MGITRVRFGLAEILIAALVIFVVGWFVLRRSSDPEDGKVTPMPGLSFAAIIGLVFVFGIISWILYNFSGKDED